MTVWNQFDDGKTLGTLGSEDGVVVLDAEHEFGARITLENVRSRAPWAITCGIYGSMMHTAFAAKK